MASELSGIRGHSSIQEIQESPIFEHKNQDDSIKKDNKGENQVKFLPCHSFKSAQNGPKLTGLKQEFRFELRFSRDKFRLILGLRKCKKNNPTSI